jgi:hypothetical protein
MTKQIVHGEDSRLAILRGVNTLADAVKTSPGHADCGPSVEGKCMSKKFLLCVLVGAAMLLLSAILAGALDRRDDLRDIDRIRYNWRAEQVYEGSVGSKGYAVDGLTYFQLRMSDSTAEVQIGPEELVARSGFKLKIGEMVTAMGMPLVWNGRHIVLAREVSNMTSVLVVRDLDGYPMWDMNRPIRMDPELSKSHLYEMTKR